MKRSIQATLTGEAFKAKPVYGESSVGSGNQTLYCEFVDAFCRVSPRARTVAISEVQDEWRKVRSNPADVRRRIDELNAMAQKAKCASGWKVTISASPQPSSSSDRSASRIVLIVRIGVLDIWRECHRVGPFVCRVLSLSSRKLVLSRPHHVDRTFISWSAKNFFHGCLYAFNVCVHLEGGGGSTQTNIVRLKQNVDNWRRPLILKTIGNRKGDCAWRSRWQTQPEKICKSQRTNQCQSLRTLHWFVVCRFSQVVFVTSNNVTHNLLFHFQYCKVTNFRTVLNFVLSYFWKKCEI